MFFRLLILFIGVPILEIALLIRIGEDLGFWPTIGLVVFTGVLGSSLMRQQGSAVWYEFNAKMQRGQFPGQELIDGLIVLVAGVLLLTPGVMTDFVGFVGLLPHTRSYIRKYIQKRLERAQAKGSVGFHFNVSGNSTTHQPPKSEDEPKWQGTAKNRPDYVD